VEFRTYDHVVANPPFSDKTWSTGLTPAQDSFQRFTWGYRPRSRATTPIFYTSSVP
jgi:type I restriction enzyme M protein